MLLYLDFLVRLKFGKIDNNNSIEQGYVEHMVETERCMA